MTWPLSAPSPYTGVSTRVAPVTTPSDVEVAEAADGNTPKGEHSPLTLERQPVPADAPLQRLACCPPRGDARAACAQRSRLSRVAVAGLLSLGTSVGAFGLAAERFSLATSRRREAREQFAGEQAFPYFPEASGPDVALRTGFDAVDVPNYFPVVDRYEPLFFLPDAAGEADYGIHFTGVPATARDITHQMSVQPTESLPCANRFALQNRAAYERYVRKMLSYMAQDGNDPQLFPGLPVVDGTAQAEPQWAYDSQLDRVDHPDGSEGTPCRTRTQDINFQVLAGVINRTDWHEPLVQPALGTGFFTIPMNLRRPYIDLGSIRFFMPDALAQQDYGLHFAKVPNTATRAGLWLQLAPIETLACPNEFALRNRQLFLDHLQDAVRRERDHDADGQAGFPASNGFSGSGGNWTYDEQLDRVVMPDGLPGPACRTPTQQENLDALERAASEAGKRGDAVRLWTAEHHRREQVSADLTQSAGDAQTLGYAALAAGGLGVAATLVAVQHRNRGQAEVQTQGIRLRRETVTEGR